MKALDPDPHLLQTQKDLRFIVDPGLRIQLGEALVDIDKSLAGGSQRGVIFGSVSAIEGILRHVLGHYATSVSAISNYPAKKDATGSKKRKKIDEFVLDDCIKVAKELLLLPRPIVVIPSEYIPVFDELRSIRNYVHPELEVKDAKRSPIRESKVSVGSAQLAVAALDLLLVHHSQRRFIAGRLWRVVSGEPSYSETTDRLELPLDATILHSCLITRAFENRQFTLEFDLETPKKSVFNFMYNVTDRGFSAIRIDTRTESKDGYPDDGVLDVTFHPRFSWGKRCFFTTTGTVPDPNADSRRVKIVSNGRALKFFVGPNELHPKTKVGPTNEWGFDPSMEVGLFNEEGRVLLSKISVTAV